MVMELVERPSRRVWLWSSWSGLQEGIGHSSQGGYQQNEEENKIKEEQANQDKI
jgi:hypothetical protein